MESHGQWLSRHSRAQSEEVRDDGCREERRTYFRRDFNADVSTLREYSRIEAGAARRSARRGIRIAVHVGYERAVAYVAGRDRARINRGRASRSFASRSSIP